MYLSCNFIWKQTFLIFNVKTKIKPFGNQIAGDYISGLNHIHMFFKYNYITKACEKKHSRARKAYTKMASIPLKDPNYYCACMCMTFSNCKRKEIEIMSSWSWFEHCSESLV